MSFTVLVCGGRDFTQMAKLCNTLDALHSIHSFTKLIHGGARGADRLAGWWARTRNVEELKVPADWDAYGKAAGPIRNEDMANMKPNLVVVFPGGRGTASMRQIAEEHGLSLYIVL